MNANTKQEDAPRRPRKAQEHTGGTGNRETTDRAGHAGRGRIAQEEPPAAEEIPGDERIQVYTVKQVAETLQVGRDKVFMLIRTGRLRSIKIGRLRRITARQLADFIASLEE
ncbi:excisionase family DNA-binding protein [Actinomadura sp. LD22]|uniref:Excisionase family DNA-binding protein n=1 Tax=Actinomadura physcomitrii TaxID=2650748 RepID=A0A6I4MA53_9ACTN|nr:helix-turn-helix domain-containing protein [Actinomadura physcomitrii]MWA02310.1 excisionase family DNA-binding protein [Actinomadura physcomitrii]MWA03118.1 excisionase family DNA-binding protein [Actinomadura physcomitrii]